MQLLLASFPKTLPSNYDVQPVSISEPQGETPGFSCTEEQWAKAQRMEGEYFSWEDYMECQMPKMEHPAYLERYNQAQLFKTWDELLKKLEPLPRNP